MSNFMFPVCKNINCGNKKEREIEIEKKLDIAIKALKKNLKIVIVLLANVVNVALCLSIINKEKGVHIV